MDGTPGLVLAYLMVFVVAGPFIYAGMVLPMRALIHLLRTPREDWARIGRDRHGWLNAVLFGSFIGAGQYMRIVKPELEAVKQARLPTPSSRTQRG
jgi:hypothetical protein